MGKIYRNSTFVLRDLLESLTSKKLMSEVERTTRLSFDVASILVNQLAEKKYVDIYKENNRNKYQLSPIGLEFLKHLRIWCE